MDEKKVVPDNRPENVQASEQEGEQQSEQDKVLAIVGKGAKWGSIVGFVFAQIIISANSPLGFYLGNMGLLYLVCIGGGAAVGALFAWLSTMMGDDA